MQGIEEGMEEQKISDTKRNVVWRYKNGFLICVRNVKTQSDEKAKKQQRKEAKRL